MGSKPVKISASRGASILGLSQWKTPLDTWIEIMYEKDPAFMQENNFEPPDPVDNASVKWGTAAEDAIVLESEHKQKRTITQREKLYKHPKHDFITCHVDGIYNPNVHSSDFYSVHEAKTTNMFTFRESWGLPGSDKIPREYQIQVQHQMMCTEIDNAVVSVLIWPKRPDEFEAEGILPDPKYLDNWIIVLSEMGFFHQYIIEENKVLQQMLIDAYVAWYELHIKQYVTPEPVNYSDIKKLIPNPAGTIVADEQIERWSAEYKGITQEIRSANKRKEEIKTNILKYINDKTEAVADDESADKWILRNNAGKKLHQYDGKVFR